jgi:hypothetical protein
MVVTDSLVNNAIIVAVLMALEAVGAMGAMAAVHSVGEADVVLMVVEEEVVEEEVVGEEAEVGVGEEQVILEAMEVVHLAALAAGDLLAEAVVGLMVEFSVTEEGLMVEAVELMDSLVEFRVGGEKVVILVGMQENMELIRDFSTRI